MIINAEIFLSLTNDKILLYKGLKMYPNRRPVIIAKNIGFTIITDKTIKQRISATDIYFLRCISEDINVAVVTNL